EKAATALQAAAMRLAQFRKQHRVVQLAAQQDAQTRDFIDLQARVRAAESNITTTGAQIQELRALLEKEPVDLYQDHKEANPRLADLQKDLDALLSQRRTLLRDFQPTSEKVQLLERDIAEMQKLVDAEPKEITTRTPAPNPARPVLQTRLAEAQAALQGYQAEYNAAQAKVEARKSMVDNLGPWEVEQTRLTQERDSAQAAYTMLSDRLRDLEIRRSAAVRGAR